MREIGAVCPAKTDRAIADVRVRPPLHRRRVRQSRRTLKLFLASETKQTAHKRSNEKKAQQMPKLRDMHAVECNRSASPHIFPCATGLPQ